MQSDDAGSETTLVQAIRDREQLCAAVGLLNANVDGPDRFASPFDLAGMHECDVVAGDRKRGAYSLVELEDATPLSIFEITPNTPYWSTRFNRGYSQVLDWLCLLDGLEHTPQFREIWGDELPSFVGVLIAGRSASLTPAGYNRLRWRIPSTASPTTN